MPKAEGDLLFKMAAQFGVGENDDRFVMLAAMAPMLARLTSLSESAEQLVELLDGAPRKIRDSFTAGTQGLTEIIETEVHRAIGSGIEIMSQEVRSQARDLATSEFNAATQIRHAAIEGEVRNLRDAAVAFATAGGTASSGTSPSGGPRRFTFAGFGWAWFVLAFVLGLVAEAGLMRLIHPGVGH